MDDEYTPKPTPIEGVRIPNGRYYRRKSPMKKALEIIGIGLGVLVGAGTVAGVIGQAFYVKRDEYTTKIIEDMRLKTKTEETLKTLSDTMAAQQIAFKEVSGVLGEVRIELAAGKKRRER